MERSKKRRVQIMYIRKSADRRTKKLQITVDFGRFPEIPHKHWGFLLCTNNVHKPV